MSKKRAKKSVTIELPSVIKSSVQNPVAKFAYHFNNAVFFRDRTSYSRKNKHKGTEPFSLYLHAAVAVYRERFTHFFDDFKFQISNKISSISISVVTP
jgi:hypothetical protein